MFPVPVLQGGRTVYLLLAAAAIFAAGSLSGWTLRAKIADRAADLAAAKIALAEEQRETCRANLAAQGQAVRELQEAEKRLATKAAIAIKSAAEYRGLAEDQKSRLEALKLTGEECHDLRDRANCRPAP